MRISANTGHRAVPLTLRKADRIRSAVHVSRQTPWPLKGKSMNAMLGAFSVMLLLSFPSLSQAADIYRWVDEQGRTHASDVVPERYRGVAVRIDSKLYQPSERQRAEAADRAARDRAALSEIEAARQARSQANAGSSASPDAATRQAAGSPGSECERLWKEYHESQVCFAPYQLGGRGVKAEAYSKCKEVPNPSQKCGPSKHVAP